MSKYDPLWEYIRDNNVQILTFEEAEMVCGFPVDHSFLRYKKELTGYGYMIRKISVKEQKIMIDKLQEVQA